MRKKLKESIAVAAAVGLLLPFGTGVAGAADSPRPNPIKDCLSKMVNPRLAIQFLIDESKSLQKSDPLDKRVDAINSSIATLTFNFVDVDEKAKENLQIDIRLTGFAKKFQDHGSDWVSLTENDNSSIYAEVEKFRERDQDGVTNYQAGLEGAERSFVDYDRSRTGEVACKALVWLTDGNLDLDNSSSDQKPENKQKKKLCESGGVVDRLRSQQVFVIGLGLNSNSSKKQDFSLMSQMLVGGCGEREPFGTFTEVESADDLIREMFRNLVSGNPNELVPCKGEEQNDNCREVRFSVRPPLSRINVLVGLTKEIDSASVINPDNETVSFAQGGKAVSVQDGRVKSQPSFDLSTILKIDVNELPGEWRLQFRGVGADDALVMSVFFSDVVIEIEDLPLRIDRREPQPIKISLGDLGLDGLEDVDAPGSVAEFDSPLSVSAELSLGSSLVKGVVTESGAGPGSFFIAFNAEQLENVPSNGVLTLTPVAVLGGQEINFTPRVENVALVLGDGFPTIKAVSATDIDSDGKSKVSITIEGPEEGSGSVRIDPNQFVATEVPAGYEANEVAVSSTDDKLVSVESGKSRVVEFEVDPAFKANGRFKGEVQVELKNSFGESQTQKVAFDFSMTKPFDTAKFLWVLAVMLLSFLVVQGAIVFFAATRFSIIGKVPSDTYYARFRVRLNPNGSVDIVRPSAWFDVFRDCAHPVMSAVSGKSKIDFDEFTIRGTRLHGVKCLVAGSDPSLFVTWPGFVVVGSRSSSTDVGGVGRISPRLAGEWAVAVVPSDALALARNSEESELPAATYIDHLTGEVREIEKNQPIEVEVLYFIAGFDGTEADSQIDDMISHLETSGIREVVASVSKDLGSSDSMKTGPLGSKATPGDSEKPDSPPPISWSSPSVDDEYG